MSTTLEQGIGENVARYRRLRGWNQAELGKALEDSLGKPWQRQSVWAAENGKRSFSAADLIGLSDALGVTVQELLKVEKPVTAGERTLKPGDVLNLVAGDADTRRHLAMFNTAADVKNVTRHNEHLYWGLVREIRQAAATNTEVREGVQAHLDKQVASKTAEARRQAEQDGDDVSTPEKLEAYMHEWGYFDVPVIVAARDVLKGVDHGEGE